MALETRIENGIAFVVHDEPKRGNSFGIDSAEALSSFLKKIKPSKKSSKSEIRALLFQARGRIFCAGGNLDDYAKMKTSAQGKKVNRRITEVLDELAIAPIPTACIVNGDCYGGGVEVLSAFDKVFSVPEAMFGLWQRRIALGFGWGGGRRLSERVPLRKLKQLSLETRAISSYEALVVGLIDEIHLQAVIEEHALQWLRTSSSLPKTPVALIKKFAAKDERKNFERMWWGEEHRSALKRRSSRA